MTDTEPWFCPGCGRRWEDLPLGHHWTYTDGGSCGDVTRPVSPAEFMQATRKEQR